MGARGRADGVRQCDDSATGDVIHICRTPRQCFGDVSRHNLSLNEDRHSGAGAGLVGRLQAVSLCSPGNVKVADSAGSW